MKNKSTYLSLAIVAMCISTNLFANTWNLLGNVSFSPTNCQRSSLALDGTIPYVVYNDGNQGSKACVKKFTSLGWQTVGALGFTPGSADVAKIAILNHTPYIIFSDGSVSGKISMMKFDGTNWVYVGTAGLSSGLSVNMDLININDTLYFAFKDLGVGKMRCKAYDGATMWDVGSPTGISAGNIGALSLCAYGTNPLVCFSDQSVSGACTAMSFDGTAWSVLGAAGFSASSLLDLGCTVASGVPYVVVRDPSVSSKATSYMFNGTAWVLADVAGFTPAAVACISMCSMGGEPYALFLDYNIVGMGVQKFNGTNWVSVLPYSITTTGANVSKLQTDGTALYASFDRNFNSDDNQLYKYVNCASTTSSWSPSICSGDSVVVAGHAHLTAATYVDTLFGSNSTGCDSIITTTLSFNPAPSAVVGSDVTICSGTSLTIGAASTAGHTYSWSPTTGLSSAVSSNPVIASATTASYTLTETITATMCTKSNVLNISTNPTADVNTSASICQGQSMFLGGAWRTGAGIYHDTLSTSHGCDSVIHTTLSINPVYSINQNMSICQGDSALLGAMFQHSAGTYHDFYTSMLGCDSVVHTTLTVNTVYNLSDSVSICTNDSVMIGGIYRKTAGIYIDTLNTIHGCDSITARTLWVKPLPGVFPTAITPGANTLNMVNVGDTLEVQYNIFSGYQWYKDGTLLPGDTLRKYLPLTGGVYKARVMNSYQCYAFTNTKTSHVGIDEKAPLGSWSLYPNPMNGILNMDVESQLSMAATIEVTDLTGRKIREEQVVLIPGKNNLKLNMSSEP